MLLALVISVLQPWASPTNWPSAAQPQRVQLPARLVKLLEALKVQLVLHHSEKQLGL